MELRLLSDTAKRKRLFTPESFAHPAKCHIGMLEWILQEYTQGSGDYQFTEEMLVDADTIQICEQAGFLLKERHFRRLTQQSFWRTIYRHKFPDAPVLEKEDILVFVKRAETTPMRLE